MGAHIREQGHDTRGGPKQFGWLRGGGGDGGVIVNFHRLSYLNAEFRSDLTPPPTGVQTHRMSQDDIAKAQEMTRQYIKDNPGVY